MAQAYAARFRGGFVELEPVRRVVYRWKIGESSNLPEKFDVENVERTEGNSVFPYPRHRVVDPVYVATRMLSTRSGKNAWWCAGERARQGLNRAMYEPLFRGWVRDFEWAPAADAMATRENLLLYAAERIKHGRIPEASLIVQGGTLAINWSGWLIEDEDYLPEAEVREKLCRDHLRAGLGYIVETCRKFHEEPHCRQGHLLIYRMEEEDHLTQAAREFYPYVRTVFNHYITNGGVVAQWHDYFLLVVKDTLILSPNHPPLELAAGCYVGHHPVPTSRMDVD